MLPNDDGIAEPRSWRSGEYVIDLARRRLMHAGVPVDVEERAFDLIALLASRHEREIDRREIVAALWGRRPVSENTLRQVVYKARRAVGDDGQRQAVIRTLHGRSLRWVAPIEPVAEPPLAPAEPVTETPAGAARPAGERRPLTLTIAGAALLVVLVASALLVVRRPVAQPAPPLAIAPIDNATGETALDWTRNGLPGLLASLLESEGLDVVDPHVAAEAWDFKRAPGRTREQRLRDATGAAVVVDGTLRKLAGALYELDLAVQPPERVPVEIRVTGERPGTLAADAAPRIRRALGLGEAIARPAGAPADPFLAEAYARGMDAVARGRMADARSYFEVCAKGATASPSCRLGLGMAEIATHGLDEGEATLRRVLALASERGDATLAAKSLDELAHAAIVRHRFAAARDLLERAASYVAQSGDANERVTHELRVADAESRLGDADAASAALGRASALIARDRLRVRESDLHNAEALVARARGDFAGEERAERAALAASEAIGNERNAAGDAYNLALVLSRGGRRDEAIPLLARAYADARGKDAWLEFGAGDNLAIALLDTGLDQRAGAIAADLDRLALSEGNTSWQALIRLLDGAIALYRGDFAGARDAFDASGRLVDAKQDPDLDGAVLLFRAAATFASAPRDVAPIAREIDALAAAHEDASVAYSRHLVDALAAGAADRPAEARAALDAARATPHAEDTGEGNLRMVAFLLAPKHAAIAGVALAGFDLARRDDATTLRFYARWASASGNEEAARAAAARIAALREATLASLVSAPPFDASHADAGPPTRKEAAGHL
jgi:DNA-binding winged helix-turn-helix (wHTH) protein/tetratricopeptide (TPR) repeat protein